MFIRRMQRGPRHLLPAVAALLLISTACSIAESKSSFDVALIEPGPDRLKVIQVVWELTGQGLKEAKGCISV